MEIKQWIKLHKYLKTARMLINVEKYSVKMSENAISVSVFYLTSELL